MKNLQTGLIFAFLFVLFISNSIQTVSSAALLKKSGKKAKCLKKGEACRSAYVCCNGLWCDYNTLKCSEHKKK